MKAGEAFQRLLTYDFQTVLDVGAGRGEHSKPFHEAGKTVTAIDFRPPLGAPYETISADYMEHGFRDQFDCIWSSHVLEHQLSVQGFLEKVYFDLKEGGIFAVTVPPLKHQIVGGHVSLWNLGLLFYRLILAGFDCQDAIGKRYGYNISVILRKKKAAFSLSDLHFDNGDITRLAPFFPKGREWAEGFRGDMESVNWD